MKCSEIHQTGHVFNKYDTYQTVIFDNLRNSTVKQAVKWASEIKDPTIAQRHNNLLNCV